jgi:tetratricopeptide (TPR) repeat protein
MSRVARFTDELLKAPSAKQGTQLLDKVREMERPEEFLSSVAHLARERGRKDVALHVWKRVVSLKSNDKDARENLSKLLLQGGFFAEAVPHLEAWCRFEPGSNIGFALLGTTLLNLERLPEAAAALRKSLAIRADQPDVLAALASALWKQNLVPEAVGYLRQLVAIQPGHAPTLNDLGVMYLQLRQPAEAATAFRTAVQHSPDTATINHNLSIALRQLGHNDQALIHAERAAELGNPSIAMIANLGAILNDLDRFTEAEAALAGTDLFTSVNAIKTYSRTLRGLKRHPEAVTLMERGIADDPSNPELWFFLGNVLMEQGLSSKAESAFDKAIELSPPTGAPHRAKADLHRYREGDPHLAQMEQVCRADDLVLDDRIELDFALGKAYDDLRDFEQAFEHFRLGNQAKRTISSYDEAGVKDLIELVLSIFPAAVIPAKPSSATISDLPVFVVGMPRSGTTLVEQILARHPDVVGLGETHALHEALDTVIFFAPRGPDLKVSEQEFVKLGETYLKAIRPEAAGALRAIDKLPSNFFFLGFIAKALPNARIIHVRRDPIDTCISLYSKLFTKTQNFSYDLGELGRYYRQYLRVTEHWRRLLPDGCLLEVNYEDVVESTEAEIRRMLSFLDLPWNEGCLQPHEGGGVVLTASAVQVRQPIYKTSVGRREGYLPYLGPLLEELSKQE